MEVEPLTGSLPDQDPEAVHAVAPVVLHRSVLAAPAVIEAGVADNEIVGLLEAAELPGTQVPRQTTDSANTTSALRYVTANPPALRCAPSLTGPSRCYDYSGEKASFEKIAASHRDCAHRAG